MRLKIVKREPNSKTRKKQDDQIYVYRLNRKRIYRVTKKSDGKCPVERYEDGKWLSGLNGISPLLYHCDELNAAIRQAEHMDQSITIHITEGEKDCETLREHGFLATTNSGGALAWKLKFNERFCNRHVVLHEDNDKTGRDRCNKIAKQLTGIAASIKIIRYDELPEKSDVTDYLNSGKNVDDLKQKIEQTEVISPEPLFISAGELVNANPLLRAPVIHGLLRQGETMNVIAAPKTGKSWLVLQLALSVVTGQRWLNFDTEQGNVLLLDNELHPETLSKRIEAVANRMSLIPKQWNDRLHINSLRGRLQDLKSMETYFQTLEVGQHSIIILDAFYRFLPEGMDENSNASMANLYNLLDKYAKRLGCCFVLIHHTTKGLQGGKSVTDVGAGAGAQSRAADCHLILRAHQEEDCLSVDAVARSWPPPEPFVIRQHFPVWKPDKTLNPSDLKREHRQKKNPDDDTMGQTTEEKQIGKIINALEKSDNGESQTALKGLTGLERSVLKKHLAKLVKDGRVKTRDGSKSNNSCTIYSLAKPFSSEGTGTDEVNQLVKKMSGKNKRKRTRLPVRRKQE